MLKILFRAIVSLLLLALIAVGIGLYFLQDANRFKPELTQIIEEQTGVPVSIDGDLSWTLFPPLSLSAEKISADYQGSQYELDTLQLNVDLMSVIRTRDIDRWQVRSLVLDELIVTQESNIVDVGHFELTDFSPGIASPFQTQVAFRSGDQPAIPLTANGFIAYHLDDRRAELTKTRFETTGASGICDIEATFRDSQAPVDSPEAIIPISVWRGIDWEGACELDQLVLAEETFTDVAITLDNTSGNSSTEVVIPDFFGGSAGVSLAINARVTPVTWRIEPDLKRADSQAVMTWLNKRLKWVAPLAYSGAITMTGNTREELVNSVRGTTRFDGGQGRIDITQIKQPLLGLANLFKEGARIAAWPEMWDYQRLMGEWQINGKTHAIDMALDNLTANINGDYDPLSDALDMRMELQFVELPDLGGFDVNPVLLDLPVPLNCSGTLEAPVCRVDPAAAKSLVSRVLTSESGSEVRRKLDEKIDEEVPEEYREAARGLLDILGKSLKKKKD